MPLVLLFVACACGVVTVGVVGFVGVDTVAGVCVSAVMRGVDVNLLCCWWC